VFPEAAHCLCTYHMTHNLRKHFRIHTAEVKEAFVAAARAYTVEEYNKHMSDIEKLNPRVTPFLEGIGIHKWARVHCPNNRFFTMTSNAAETINSAIRDVRDLPITTLLESLRALQQKWNVANRDEAKSTFTTLTKKAHRMLEENYKFASILS
ncbi:Unknown protein, partial [Striga hermonthica]